MGCDIHSIVQVRNRFEDAWETVAYGLSDNRNYDAFYLLAGVRGCGLVDPIDTARGLPPEVEKVTETDGHAKHIPRADAPPYYLGEHSFSHVTLAEMKEKIEDMLDSYLLNSAAYESDEYVVPKVFQDYYDILELIRVANDLNASEIRLVFGFDS